MSTFRTSGNAHHYRTPAYRYESRPGPLEGMDYPKQSLWTLFRKEARND